MAIDYEHLENMAADFPDYPCTECKWKGSCGKSTCKDREIWFSIHWKNIYETGQKLIKKKGKRITQKRVRVVADVRKVIQEELKDWIKRNRLDGNILPAVRELENGELVKRIIDRLIDGK